MKKILQLGAFWAGSNMIMTYTIYRYHLYLLNKDAKRIYEFLYGYYRYYIIDMKNFKVKYYKLHQNNKELLSNFEYLQKSSNDLFIKNEILEEEIINLDEEKLRYENINIDLTHKIDILTFENQKLQKLIEEYEEKIKKYNKLFSERSKKTVKYCAKKNQVKKKVIIFLFQV